MSGATSWDLAWVVGVLKKVPEVDLHGFTVAAKSMWLLDPLRQVSEPVPTATLAITVADMRCALLLVDLLTLRQTDTMVLHDDSGITTTHTWAGWSAEASSDIAVRVEITASERPPRADVTDREVVPRCRHDC